MAEWRNGGMAEWRNGRMVVEWRNRGIVEWQNGGMAAWRNGGMAEWRNGGVVIEVLRRKEWQNSRMAQMATYLLFTVDTHRRQRRRRHFNLL